MAEHWPSDIHEPPPDSICAAMAHDRDQGASLADLSRWYGLPWPEVQRLLNIADARYPFASATPKHGRAERLPAHAASRGPARRAHSTNGPGR